MLIRKILVLLIPSTFTACATVLPLPEPPEQGYPRMTAVLSEEVEIRGAGWAITTGDPTPPPFQNKLTGSGKNPAQLLDHYPTAIADGAKFCRVKVPGRSKPLYGVLALNPVFQTSTESSAKRVYRIVVKQSRVESALGGQVSLLYQPYNFTRSVRATNANGDHYYKTEKGLHMSWLLWISDAPFPGQKS